MSCATPTMFKVNIIKGTGKSTRYDNINSPTFIKDLKNLQWPTPSIDKGTVSSSKTGVETYNFFRGNFHCYLSKRCENNKGIIDYTCLSLSPYKQGANTGGKGANTGGKGANTGGKGCPNINIHNSKHEWDVIHGINGEEHKVHCNDGYSFNHDLLHQGGKIKCTSVPNKPNTYDWYIKDDYLESKCKAYTT